MTRTTPLRRTILHFRQILFTEAITFIVLLLTNLHFGLRPPYFALKVIRPLLRSYGVSCTVTLSPGRMRM